MQIPDLHNVYEHNCNHSVVYVMTLFPLLFEGDSYSVRRGRKRISGEKLS